MTSVGSSRDPDDQVAEQQPEAQAEAEDDVQDLDLQPGSDNQTTSSRLVRWVRNFADKRKVS